METRADPSVSIDMPARRRHPETREDPIRFKNLLRLAEDRLRGTGRVSDARGILEPGHALLGDSGFWQHQSDGLAVFAAPGEFRHYRLPWCFPSLPWYIGSP